MMFISVQGRGIQCRFLRNNVTDIGCSGSAYSQGWKYNRILREIAAHNLNFALAEALYLNQLLHIWKGFLYPLQNSDVRRTAF